ncbi:MAG TPA: EamA family transporter [Terriglobales bacterium]|nr:EamA family transporter [Terriglobales bacterium]
MTALALALVLSAAVLHAGWNLLAKRVAGGIAFIWLVCTTGALVYFPVAIAYVLVAEPPLAWPMAAFIAGSAVIHLAYFFLLQRGYQVGDLSLVYPLARSTGPALSTAGAVVLFAERPSPLAAVGIVLVLFGVYVLTSAARHSPKAMRQAVVYGLLTGSLIAVYTLWDGYAVQRHGVPPLLLDWGSNLGRSLLLLPLMRTRQTEARRCWQEHRWRVVTISVVSTLSYIMILTAVQFTPISYVAPAREISILVGAMMGQHFLDEQGGSQRIAGAAIMVAGVIALAAA